MGQGEADCLAWHPGVMLSHHQPETWCSINITPHSHIPLYRQAKGSIHRSFVYIVRPFCLEADMFITAN